MGKYLFRYMVFWIPAMAVATLFNNSSTVSQVLQWFFAFFLVFSWSVNTGAAAYHFPRRALSLLLIYSGVALLTIVIKFNSFYGSLLHTLSKTIGGALCATPLSIMVETVSDFEFTMIPEYYVLGFFMACCLIGYFCGILYRRVRPNPYRPKIVKQG